VKRYKDRFFEINGLIGNEAAAQIQEIIKNTIWQNHFSIMWVVLRYLLSDYRFGEIKILSILFNLNKTKARLAKMGKIAYSLLLLDCWFKFFY
jgi:hypothetical protein